MKNVAKCDTWCELQNPVNHRVFERKLRPKRLRGGHVCLGVTQRRPEPKRPVSGDVGGGTEAGLPWRSAAAGLIQSPGTEKPRQTGGRKILDRSVVAFPCAEKRTEDPCTPVPSIATPGQAGPPAEFKHINKRRKRNLPGFP